MRGQKLHSPQSVHRVLRILDLLSTSADPLSLAEISRRLASPKSSIVSLLHGLEEAHYVRSTENGWWLGSGAFGLGSALVAARERLPSSVIIHAGMVDLAKASGETVIFAVLNEDRTGITYLDVVESRETVRFTVSIGNRRELYCTAGGRVLLSEMTPQQVDDYLASVEPAAWTDSTMTDRQAICDAVSVAREAGVAQTIDQAANGATGTAALVRAAGGQVPGALIVASPTARSRDRLADLRQQVLDAAASISRNLGFTG